MSMSDRDGATAIRRGATRLVDQVASLLPTVRARLSALVVMALVPALVILGYDEWLARERALRRLTGQASTQVVRLMQRELDDRITRGAHRLGRCWRPIRTSSFARLPRPASWSKRCATISLYNNLLIADGTTGDVRASAVPLDRTATRVSCSRSTGPPHPRLRHRRVPSRTGNARAGPQPRPTRHQRARQRDVRRAGKPRPRMGRRVHRTLRICPRARS